MLNSVCILMRCINGASHCAALLMEIVTTNSPATTKLHTLFLQRNKVVPQTCSLFTKREYYTPVIHTKLKRKPLLLDRIIVSLSYHSFILVVGAPEETHQAVYSSPWCPLDIKLPAVNKRTLKRKVKCFIWETQRAASGSGPAKMWYIPVKGEKSYHSGARNLWVTGKMEEQRYLKYRSEVFQMTCWCKGTVCLRVWCKMTQTSICLKERQSGVKRSQISRSEKFEQLASNLVDSDASWVLTELSEPFF